MSLVTIMRIYRLSQAEFRAWREHETKEIYTPAEVVVLTRHHSIPWPIRVLNAIAFFTGMREGEVCGRRWRDLEDASVLPAIVVRDQYEGRPLKTERPRVCPFTQNCPRF